MRYAVWYGDIVPGLELKQIVKVRPCISSMDAWDMGAADCLTAAEIEAQVRIFLPVLLQYQRNNAFLYKRTEAVSAAFETPKNLKR